MERLLKSLKFYYLFFLGGSAGNQADVHHSSQVQAAGVRLPEPNATNEL